MIAGSKEPGDAMSDDEEVRKPHWKRPTYSPKQRIARCKRKIAGYLRQIDRMRDGIDEQVLLMKTLEAQVEGFEKDRMVRRAIKQMEKIDAEK